MREQEQAMREQYEEEAARIRAGFPPSRPNRQREQDEEDEELLRAIAESQRMHEGQGADPQDDDDDDMDVEGHGEGEELPVIPPPLQPQRAATLFPEHRVYDDDDAELQAALKASLETVPEGFRLPSTPPRPQAPSLPSTSNNPPPNPGSSPSPIETSSSQSTEYETASEADSSPMEEEAPVNVEEMRRRRLAKFGG